MRLLVDTNVLVYDTVEDSEHHKEASEIIDSATLLYIPSIVVHEYSWILLRYLNLNPVFTLTKMLEYLEDPRAVYQLESLDTLKLAFVMLKEDGGVVKEINDYIVLAFTIVNKLSLATFDRELRRKAGKRGVKVIPE
ncbi:PIN domain-containing protein [Candidatus Bathyarchaeota archaeon]|nr:PIN domain-containing protein [Candidatus Bathyarchaeota archaeon]MBS7613586.1 PIN domain-containing protein [Candidatus Bathyarchaeota archaeon]MBS7618830.1 PIN domain-containing protein [Candidatus Bathyarchaeota archaeon]